MTRTLKETVLLKEAESLVETLLPEAQGPALNRAKAGEKNQTRQAKEKDRLLLPRQALSRRWPLPVRDRPLRGCQPLLRQRWSKKPVLWLVLLIVS